MSGQTVVVRVQVIDMQPQVLDVVVPTYLNAGNLTQRIARDAGLQSYWPDRSRRLYWMRARGRLMAENETLADLGVIDNELVYLLPQPPQGMGVLEQNPDYPEVKGYAGKGLPLLISTLVGGFVWSVFWSLAVYYSDHWVVEMTPGLGLGVLSVSFSRHAFGGSATKLRVLLAGLALYCMLVVPGAVIVPLALDLSVGEFFSTMIQGVLAGLIGVLFSWVAWWGAVEPLPENAFLPAQQSHDHDDSNRLHECGVCGGGIQPNVLAQCQCGKFFHQGCFTAQKAIYNGPPGFCEVCRGRLR